MLGVLPGIVGSMQALETLKLILGIGEPLIGRLLLFDALTMEFRSLKTRRDPACPVCGDSPTITALIDYHEFCASPIPRSWSSSAKRQTRRRRGRPSRRWWATDPPPPGPGIRPSDPGRD